MATLLPAIKRPFLDDNGNPLSGGKLYSYIAGTTTKRATYSDSTGETPNTNPIILDSSGVADIYLATGSYKFTLTDSADVEQWTMDNVDSSDSVSATAEDSGWTEHAVTDGQSATDLEGETIDFTLYSAGIYEAEIIRGSPVTVHSVLQVTVQKFDGSGRVLVGLGIADEAHGVTFSISLSGTVATLRAATSSGPGAGTIKLTRRLVPV